MWFNWIFLMLSLNDGLIRYSNIEHQWLTLVLDVNFMTLFYFELKVCYIP
jgi:hypothetical protein